MKQLLKELARINAAKKRASKLISDSCGCKCLVTVHTDATDVRPLISIHRYAENIKCLYFLLKNGVFEPDNTQTAEQMSDSDLLSFSAEICEILNKEFGDSEQTTEKKLLDETIAALVELHESLEDGSTILSQINAAENAVIKFIDSHAEKFLGGES